VRTGQFRRGRLWARFIVWRLREGWARLPIGVRFLWMLLGVMLGLMTPLLGIGYLFLQRSLEAHRQFVQYQRLAAAVSALDREIAALLRQVQDYTVWNDAHAAVQRRDTEWVRRNIVDWLPGQFYYDFAMVVDAEGAWVVHTAGEWEWLRRTAPFQQAMRGIGNAGLHRRGERIYILAAAPIVDDQWLHPPAGVLIVGKAIDETLLRRVSQSAGHTGALRVRAVMNPPSPPLLRGERAREWGDSNRVFTTAGAQALLNVSQLLYDSAGRPIAWLQVEPPRAEQAWLLHALYLAKQYLFVFGGALALTASLTMVLLLKSQLRRFTVAIQRLATGDWDARVAYPARDEFGYLAHAFNQMALQLQQAFEMQEQQREELLAQKEELERVHQQLQQAHQELATLNAELVEANRALAQAAVTDGLTGLKNHRAFQEALHSAAQMAERLQQPLSLIMFDIDHFKQFNDRFGHPAGDELLQQVAQVLRESARAYDVAARYGGEEFALLLPNTALEQAVQVAERLRQQIRAIRNPHAPISASFGVATYRRGTPPATLVYEADAALYRAKRNGRDQVCVYQPEAA
jgi:diguanylate cyclase (GGDEF)-like protein